MGLLSAVKFLVTPRSSIEVSNEKMFSTAVLKVDHVFEIDTVLAKLLPQQSVYESVAKTVNKDMPWWVVCLEHAMEAGAMKTPFAYHLHCGDLLSGRTWHVPKGRPIFNPKHGSKPPSVSNPYLWAESAVDALLLVGYDTEKNWSLGNILWEFEKFNGTGYRKYHPKVPSPYIWSFTTLYSKGKYVGDGHFDPNVISQQPGCAAYLLRMKEKGLVKV